MGLTSSVLDPAITYNGGALPDASCRYTVIELLPLFPMYSKWLLIETPEARTTD
jgi:hypothetical protein